jgi:uncharacterized membrane protein YebE (DUF533 family)
VPGFPLGPLLVGRRKAREAVDGNEWLVGLASFSYYYYYYYYYSQAEPQQQHHPARPKATGMTTTARARMH